MLPVFRIRTAIQVLSVATKQAPKTPETLIVAKFRGT
jgi:hypothetical protein